MSSNKFYTLGALVAMTCGLYGWLIADSFLLGATASLISWMAGATCSEAVHDDPW